MTDCKIISILKKMREEEKELICADFDTETTLGYTHGDKAEALNNAIFELEHKDEFYIDKSVIEDKIEKLKQKLNTDNNIRIYTLKDSYELQISILQELLESSDINE